MTLDAQQTLDRHFLEIRARLLDLAAMLDRVDRGDGGPLEDPRLAKIESGLKILLEDHAPDRAARIQQLFSRPYDPAWRTTFKL
jgi:hypothetical protein